MVVVTARTVVRLQGVFFFLIPPNNDQGIEKKSRALFPVNCIITVGIERIRQAVRMFTVGGKGYNIGRDIQHKPGGGIKNVLPEIENQGRKNVQRTPLKAVIPYHIGKTLIIERCFINNPGSDIRELFQEFFQREGILYSCNVFPALNIPAPISKGIFGIIREPRVI